jgi:hypothetical protein
LLKKNEVLQFTKNIGLTHAIVGVALRKRKQKGYDLAGIMGRNNPRPVYHTLWVGKLLNNQQVVYRTNTIRFYWRFSNRCFHGIIHPLKNGLDISNSFQGLGKLFVDWVFFGINSQQQLPKIPLRKWIPPIKLKKGCF